MDLKVLEKGETITNAVVEVRGKKFKTSNAEQRRKLYERVAIEQV